MSEQTKTFDNVALYRAGMFGVSRIDCKTVEITTGVKYAQYDDATRVRYLEKGKRKAAGFMLDYKPWLRLLPVSTGVVPADALMPAVNGGRQSRYTSYDPRYITDFEDQFESAPWLVAIGAGDREGVHLERCKAMDGTR
jgi:hypothetical protein